MNEMTLANREAIKMLDYWEKFPNNSQISFSTDKDTGEVTISMVAKIKNPEVKEMLNGIEFPRNTTVTLNTTELGVTFIEILSNK